MIRNAFLLFAICAVIFVVFLPSYLQMQELNEKNGSYERQIRELSRENEALLVEKRRLEEDPAYFERYAREKFGIIKDGEMIYKIVPAGTPGLQPVVNSQVAKPATTAVGVATKKIAKPKAKAVVSKAKTVDSKTVKSPAKKRTSSASVDHLDPLRDLGAE
ncbi:MAG: septum formation initiator family protein [Candidatus Omnitrophica bacterium]|nr:septum formation initiator family protein [Candidatus Omnitrophota bacterium]